MKTGAVVGCLHVESKTLRSALARTPSAILSQVGQLPAQLSRAAPARSCLEAM